MKKGMVVRSLKGHDEGTVYVVLDILDGNAFVCDGKNKLVSGPKKKNCKHLGFIGKEIDLSMYKPLYDAHIRKELKDYKEVEGLG